MHCTHIEALQRILHILRCAQFVGQNQGVQSSIKSEQMVSTYSWGEGGWAIPIALVVSLATYNQFIFLQYFFIALSLHFIHVYILRF